MKPRKQFTQNALSLNDVYFCLMQERLRLNTDYIRSNFPMLKQTVNGKPLIYMDSGATALKPQIVIDSVSDCYENYYSNVHRGVHHFSQQATLAFEQVRLKVQEYISAKHDYEVIFTRGTTESINILASSFSKVFLKSGDVVLISEMEHHANIVPWQMASAEYGFVVKAIPINDAGELDMQEYQRLLDTENVKLVSVQHVSNVLGTINPVEEIITQAHNFGAKIHLDGAQAVPHMKPNVQELDVDFYSFSGHKLFGPTGTGVLYGKEDFLNKMPPFLGGGAMIKEVTLEKTTYNTLPFKFETGTPNIAEFIGLGAAIDYINNIGIETIAQYEEDLCDYATSALSKIDGLRMIGTSAHKVATFSFVIDGLHSFDIGTLLNEYGIAVRTGHHCCQPLMHRMGVENTIRASLAFYNTFEEIDFFVDKLQKVIKMLR